MMNVVALFLVLSSLVTAGVWSPTPEKQPSPTDDVIVKNGHQKLVVEFDKEDGNTKVLISPQEAHKPPLTLDDKCYVPTASKGAAEDAKEKVKEALGKCMDKAKEVEEHATQVVFEVIGKSKENVELKTSEISGKVHEVKDAAKDAIREAPGKAKERAFDKAQEVKEAVSDLTQKGKETVTGKAQEVKEVVGGATQKAKETVWDATQKAREKVTGKAQNAEEFEKEMAKKAKEGANAVIDTSKTMGKDVERNVATTIQSGREKAQQGGEAAEHFAERVKGNTKRVKEEGEKDLNEILRRGREVGYDVLVYVVSPTAVEPALGVVQLLGFAASYGLCLWVTFVSSYVLAGALPTQQFGVVQSKIYPVYFRTMAYSVALALVGHMLSHRKTMLSNHMAVEMFLGYNLLASLLIILFNLLYLEPRATKVMFERIKVEKEEGRGRDSSISESARKAVADPAADSVATTASGADSATMATGVDPTSAPPVIPGKLEQVVLGSQVIKLSERLKKLNAYSSFLNVLTLMLLTSHLIYLGQHLHVAC